MLNDDYVPRKRPIGFLGLALLASAALTLNGQTVVDLPGSARPVGLTRPRILPLPEAQWTEEHRQRIVTFLPAGTRPGSSFRTLLNVPELIDRTMTFHNYIAQDSSLSPRVRELLMLRTAWLHGSDVLWRERVPFARKAGFTNDDLRKIAIGPAPGWDAFESNLLAVADQLFRNSFVNDAAFNQMATRYDTCNLMDVGMTIADVASLALMYNTLGVQPDEAPQADRMPLDIPYTVTVPTREAVTLETPRAVPVPGSGANNPRTFALCPKLSAARNGSGYVNQISMLGKTGRARHRELLILRMGWNSQSEYEWSEHVGPVGGGRKMGLPIERIVLGPDAPGWDPFEADLLRFADEMYRDSVVSDRTWNALKQQYDDRLMIDATITLANYRMVSLALNTLGVQTNPGEEKLPPVAGAKPGDVRLMVTAAIRTPLEAVRAQAEQAVGRRLVIEYGSARGNLKEQILAGQAFDVAMLLPDVDQELLKAGKIVSGSVEIARVDVAIGLRGDVASIDVSTPGAVKQSMLEAKSLRWAPTGAALLTVNKILDTLGIRETVKAKHNLPGTVPLGPGEYEINLYPQSEILENKALRNLGPVIPALQVPAIITAVISANTTDVRAARALITFLQGPAIEPSLKASGMRR